MVNSCTLRCTTSPATKITTSKQDVERREPKVGALRGGELLEGDGHAAASPTRSVLDASSHLSSSFRWRKPVQHLVEGESVGGGAGQQVGQDLVEHAAAFERVDVGRALVTKVPDPCWVSSDPLDLQLPVGANDGVGIDLEVHGQLPDGRQPVARLEIPRAMANFTCSMICR